MTTDLPRAKSRPKMVAFLTTLATAGIVGFALNAGSAQDARLVGLAMVDDQLDAVREAGVPDSSERILLLEAERQRILDSVREVPVDPAIAAKELGGARTERRWDPEGEVPCEPMRPHTDVLGSAKTVRCVSVMASNGDLTVTYLTSGGRALQVISDADGMGVQSQMISIPVIPDLDIAEISVSGGQVTIVSGDRSVAFEVP